MGGGDFVSSVQTRIQSCKVETSTVKKIRRSKKRNSVWIGKVGGTVLTAKLAKEKGWAINVGGGFHHCSAEHGGGFCVYEVISLCIQYAFVRLNISRVMIIDLDAYQGNGHETDFSDDRRVYILDMFDPNIYSFASLDFEARKSIDHKVKVVNHNRRVPQ